MTTKRCENICADCPFRRDSTRFTERGWGDPYPWLARYGWPGFEAYVCNVEGGTCLGWAVYLANGGAAFMAASTDAEWADQWGDDRELIFDGNNEFIRYHRGEEFGGADWFEDRKSQIGDGTPSTKFNEQGQGELF